MKYEQIKDTTDFLRKVVDVSDTTGGEDLLDWILQQMDESDHMLSLWPLEGDGKGFAEYLDDRGHIKRMRLGRYVSRNYSEVRRTITDSGVERIVNQVMSAVAFDDSDFKVLEGDDAIQIYQDQKWGGCIAGKSAWKSTLWYWENGVKALVFDNRVRALLWTNTEGKQLVDHVYPNDGTVVAAFKMWSLAHDAFMVNRQGAHMVAQYRQPCKPGSDEEVPFQVKMNFPKNGMVPFVDTLNHGLVNRVTKEIYLFPSYPRNEDGEFWTPDDSDDWDRMHFYSTDSGLNGSLLHDTEKCSKCRNYFAPVFVGSTDTYCGECVDTLTECDHCGELQDSDNMHSVETQSGVETWCYDCKCDEGTECYHCSRTADTGAIPGDWLGSEEEHYFCPNHINEKECAYCETAYRQGYGFGYRIGVGNETYCVCDEDCQDGLLQFIHEKVAELT